MGMDLSGQPAKGVRQCGSSSGPGSDKGPERCAAQRSRCARRLSAAALDPKASVFAWYEILGGFVAVRGRPGSSPSSSPSKAKGGSRTLTPTKLKRGEKGRLTVELAHTAPMVDLVAALVQAPAPGRDHDEDEATRLARRALEREKNDQRWRVKRTQLGRDEERRAVDGR